MQLEFTLWSIHDKRRKQKGQWASRKRIIGFICRTKTCFRCVQKHEKVISWVKEKQIEQHNKANSGKTTEEQLQFNRNYFRTIVGLLRTSTENWDQHWKLFTTSYLSTRLWTKIELYDCIVSISKSKTKTTTTYFSKYFYNE